ncbi:MAG: hypothetical protein DMD54_02350 [Gemmatimonadetes bacterium]|nr:MAG: hypothetical protein DMD54_02350 [Gemmatimonadota bacterium]
MRRHASRSALLAVLALGVILALACNAPRAPLDRFMTAPSFDMNAGANHGAIVFHSTRDGPFHIYAMNADGSDVRQLTNTEALDFDPLWSPSGQQIEFGRCCTGALVIMNEDGTGQDTIAENAGVGPWSPNGKQVAFGRDGDVFVMNVDGSGVRQLTSDRALDFPTGWSPNGRQILFQSERDGNRELYVMNVDGSGVTRLTNDPASDEGDHAGWSPDGKQIVFSSRRTDGNLHIFVMNGDGSDVRQVTPDGPYDDDDPFWSPDGKQIAFQSTRDGDEDVYVVNTDGTGLTQLTNNNTLDDGSPIFDAVPSWRSRPLH